MDPAKRIAIVETAWRLFLEHGVEAIALEAVATAAGVSKATLYKHFADKPTLFEAGVRREMERIEAAQRDTRARTRPTTSRRPCSVLVSGS